MPNVVSFEGIDGCGKTTLINSLAAFLSSRGVPFVTKREPGGTIAGDMIRAMLKYPDLALAGLTQVINQHKDPTEHIVANEAVTRSAICEIFLFLASRAEFMIEIVEEELKRGNHVLLDRCYDSTLAYQGGGSLFGDPEAMRFMRSANVFAMNGIVLTKTFFLDISIKTMRQRSGLQRGVAAAFEQLDNDYFERVRQTYLDIAKAEPQRVIVIDAERSAPEVFEDVLGHLRPILGIR
jgi:dTMP kinase